MFLLGRLDTLNDWQYGMEWLALDNVAHNVIGEQAHREHAAEFDAVVILSAPTDMLDALEQGHS